MRQPNRRRLQALVTAIIWGTFGWPTVILGSSLDPDDFMFKIGGAAGLISADTIPSTKDEPLFLGGVPAAIGYYHDLSESFTSLYQGQILVDFFNNQVLRTGFELGINYHLFGGSRHFSPVPGKLLYRSAYNFSLAFRSGIFNYTAVSSDNLDARITGQVLEFKLGLAMRFDVSSDTSYGLEGLSTVTSISSSVDRVTPFIGEVSAYVRKLVY